MEVIKNSIRGTGLQIQKGICKGNIKDDPSAVINLLQYCPISKETPLIENNKLTKLLRLKRIAFKDERSRMGLGSFKALGVHTSLQKQLIRR